MRWEALGKSLVGEQFLTFLHDVSGGGVPILPFRLEFPLVHVLVSISP